VRLQETEGKGRGESGNNIGGKSGNEEWVVETGKERIEKASS
jgi:hypothetical protein